MEINGLWIHMRDIMSADSECKCCDPRVAAVALGRWCLGVMFLFAGIGKFPHVGGFADYLLKQFEKTWLPSVLVSAFGHVLPFVEVILGVILLLGFFRSVALFGTGVLLISLMFGQVLLGQPQVVFFNTSYVFMAAGLLFMANYDKWVVFPRSRPAKPPES